MRKRRPVPSPELQARVVEMYVNKNLTIREISAVIRWSYGGTRSILVNNNVKMRKPGLARAHVTPGRPKAL